MNVLLAGDSSGGAFQFMATLARGLARRGCRVTVATTGPAPPCAVDLDFRILWQAGSAEWMADPWPDVDRACRWLSDLVRQVGADIVHLNCYSPGAVDLGVPTVLTAHSDVFSWWRAVHDEPAPARYEEYRRRVAAALRRADLLTAPTRAAIQAMEREFGPLPEARVVANGIDAGPGPARKTRLVLTAGRLWDEAKNVRALAGVRLPTGWAVAAAGSLNHPDGGGARPSGLRLLGELDPAEVRAWMSRSAVYVNPALYEPFGLSVAEAADAGCALVLSDIPSLRETWDGAALFFDPRTAGALQEALDRVATDRKLRADLARRARERAAAFRADPMVDAYLRIYGALSRPGVMPCAS